MTDDKNTSKSAQAVGHGFAFEQRLYGSDQRNNDNNDKHATTAAQTSAERPLAQPAIKFLTQMTYSDFDALLWRLTPGFAFTDGWLVFTLPDVFITDFYSTSLLSAVRPNNIGKYNAAAAIHDYLVRYRKLLGMSLMDCHAYFLAAMKACGMDSFKRNIKYSFVVVFNWMMAGPGDGTPGRAVRRAMRKHGVSASPFILPAWLLNRDACRDGSAGAIASLGVSQDLYMPRKVRSGGVK